MAWVRPTESTRRHGPPWRAAVAPLLRRRYASAPWRGRVTETIPRRRRWPWVLLVVVLLLIGGPTAWRFRPMNATELALVGRWTWSQQGNTCDFEANRRYALKRPGVVVATGRWSASASSLRLSPDATGSLGLASWRTTLRRAQRMLFPPPGIPLRRDGPDRFWFGESKVDRVTHKATGGRP